MGLWDDLPVAKTDLPLGKVRNLISALDIKIDADNLGIFLGHIYDMLKKVTDQNANAGTKAFDDGFSEAVNNVRKSIRVLPRILKITDVSSILNDAQFLIEVSDVDMKYIKTDFQLVFNFIQVSIGQLSKFDKSDAVRVGISIYAFVSGQDIEPDAIERTAKRLVKYYDAFRDQSIPPKNGEQKSDAGSKAFGISDLV